MPRAGGVYTLPAGNPVVTLTVISSAWANTTMSDIATALTGSLPTDGSAAMTGPLRLVDGAVGTPALSWATETTSGWYRIGANQFAFSVGGVLALSVNANRGWVIPTPVSGVTLALTEVTPGAASDRGFQLNGSGAGDARLGISTATAGNAQINLDTLGVQNWALGNIRSDGSFRISSSQTLGANDRLIISSSGNFVIPVPVAGTAVLINGAASQPALALQTTGLAAGSSFGLQIVAGTNAADLALRIINQAVTANFMQIFGDGHGFITPLTAGGMSWTVGGNFSFAAPSSGIALQITGVGGTTATLTVDGGPVYSGIPQHVIGVSTGLVLSDANKHIFFNAINLVATIPANASVAYPIGTAITFISNGFTGCTIAITTDTMFFYPSLATGTRTLAAGGYATALKVTATQWAISGVGIT